MENQKKSIGILKLINRKNIVIITVSLIITLLINEAVIFIMRIPTNSFNDHAVQKGTFSEVLFNGNDNVKPSYYTLVNWQETDGYKDAEAVFDVLDKGSFVHLNAFNSAVIETVCTKSNCVAEIELQNIDGVDLFSENAPDWMHICQYAGRRCDVVKIADDYYCIMTTLYDLNDADKLFSTEIYKAENSGDVSAIENYKVENPKYFSYDYPPFFTGLFATAFGICVYILSVLAEAILLSIIIIKIKERTRGRLA